MESGNVKIHGCGTKLLEELVDYKFPARKIGAVTKGQDKPMDKNNHGINALEWICMVLPAEPANLCYGAYNEFGIDLTDIEKLERKSGVPFALQDTQSYNSYDTEQGFSMMEVL